MQIHKALRKELSPQNADEIEQEDPDSEQAGAAAMGASKFALSLTYHALCGEPPSAERDALLALFDLRPTVAWCSIRTRTVYYSCTPAKWNPLLGLDPDALEACLSRALARIKANDRVEAVALNELHFQIEEAQARRRQEEAPVRRAATKSREGAKHGGSAPKKRAGIYKAIIDYLASNPDATNRQVWEWFPESYQEADMVGDGRYSVYRDGSKLYQTDNSQGGSRKEPSIGRATFDRYMTEARQVMRNLRRR